MFWIVEICFDCFVMGCLVTGFRVVVWWGLCGEFNKREGFYLVGMVYLVLLLFLVF